MQKSSKSLKKKINEMKTENNKTNMNYTKYKAGQYDPVLNEAYVLKYLFHGVTPKMYNL